MLDYALGDPQRQGFYWAGHDPVRLIRNLASTRLFVSAGDGQALAGEPSGPGNVLGEQNLHRLSERFVRAARRERIAVTFATVPGAHNYELSWRSLEAALPWIAASFGSPLPERPRSWHYTTVAQRSNAFGYRFFFAKRPDRLNSFSLRSGTLRGRGAGRVLVSSPDGTRLRVRLPFTRRIR